MWWALLILAVIIAAFAVPTFGKALLGVIGVLIIICVLWYLSEQAETESSKKRIAPYEIELTELTLVPGYGSGSYKLQGRIKNMSSAYTLKSVNLKLTMQDCKRRHTAEEFLNDDKTEEESTPWEKYQEQCDVVGEDDVYIWGNIPPGQTRAVDEYVSFYNMPSLKGKPTWHYAISEIKGE